MNKGERGKWKNAGFHWELNSGPLTSAPSALTTKLRQPDHHQHFTIEFSIYFDCEARSAKHKFELISTVFEDQCTAICVCVTVSF